MWNFQNYDLTDLKNTAHYHWFIDSNLTGVIDELQGDIEIRHVREPEL